MRWKIANPLICTDKPLLRLQRFDTSIRWKNSNLTVLQIFANFSFLLDSILNDIGLAATFQVLAGTMSLLMICAMRYVPVLPTNQAVVQESGGSSEGDHTWNKYVNFSIWKNKKYIIWAIAVPLSMLGYFFPYVHLVSNIIITIGYINQPFFQFKGSLHEGY